jgi:hypothetical protein
VHNEELHNLYTPQNCYSSDEMKKKEMDEACSTHGRD